MGVRLRPKPGDGGARASGVGKRGGVSEDGVDLQQRTAGSVGAFGGAQRLKGRPRHIPRGGGTPGRTGRGSSAACPPPHAQLEARRVSSASHSASAIERRESMSATAG